MTVRPSKIPISEEMAEELTPTKEDADGKEGDRTGSEGKREGRRSSVSAESAREDVLRELAKACKRQGNFHLACKKYTQVFLHYRGRVARETSIHRPTVVRLSRHAFVRPIYFCVASTLILVRPILTTHDRAAKRARYAQTIS